MSQSTQYQDLTNKVIFITGGASGIGAAMVEAFARQHAKVAFIDIDQQAADALKQKLTQNELTSIWFRAVDATDSESLQLAIRDVAEHFGRFDVLINNVANDARQDVETISAHDWHKCMQINLDPAFFASQAAYSQMKLQHSGSIINFSSITALLGSQQMTGYVTAKAGLIGMTRSLSREFGDAGIRVNAILPGWVATEKQLSSWLTEQEEQKWTDAMALKRRITPEDVAKLALFLASDNSELITGQCINIDGGRA
ncbi:3-oxoacyl-ACP reductase [Shewanella algicola]|uniref:SDR family oxidoreductase n=1 Tax=Shewanella algicola TaxID=640633 RepID=A0A9X1Z706_9GAMM|nr:SDR family oxidoreductase [Shewanella algicola]MCL1105059.1 SDR family oxidoreductase [Shewanella algicola]GGP48351.1 3-oxoacyl-ACP reductase [Shewanella algicola]